jgi:hypothetical protein
LQVDAPTDGAYPVTFVGGDVKTKMSATRVSDVEYQAEPEFVWTFRMVDGGLMNVEIDSGDGESGEDDLQAHGGLSGARARRRRGVQPSSVVASLSTDRTP